MIAQVHEMDLQPAGLCQRGECACYPFHIINMLVDGAADDQVNRRQVRRFHFADVSL